MSTRALLFLTTALLLVAVGVILGQSLPRYLWSTDAQASEQSQRETLIEARRQADEKYRLEDLESCLDYLARRDAGGDFQISVPC